MALTLERLRLLHAVSVHGTITAASAEAGYTASAVSQQLSALERELGTALLERSNRGVTLTPAGARLSKRAAVILDLVRMATIEATQAGPQAPPMTIRIGAFPTAISSIIIPAMALLEPLARLNVVHIEPEQALAALTARRLDAAVVDFYDNQPAPIRAGLHHVMLLTDPLRLAVRSDRPAPGKLADLAQAPWVLAGTESRLGRTTRAILAAVGFEPSVVIETDDHRVTFDVLSAMDAATILPGLALRAAPAHVRPAALDLRCDRHIYLVTRDVIRAHPAFPALETALRAVAPGS
jgi:DNA-binding transcriptional LysR family regulator